GLGTLRAHAAVGVGQAVELGGAVGIVHAVLLALGHAVGRIRVAAEAAARHGLLRVTVPRAVALARALDVAVALAARRRAVEPRRLVAATELAVTRARADHAGPGAVLARILAGLGGLARARGVRA